MTFVSLQALRGTAALGVVLFHLLPFEQKFLIGTPIFPAGFSAGRAGVDLFFVLSGFLAVWTTGSAVGGHAAQRFLLRRITRIYPVYWVYCIPLFFTGIGISGGLFDAGEPNLIASLVLIPNAAPPLLLVGWTLEFEVYFYLVFAVLIWARFNPRRRIVGLSAWGIAVVTMHVVLAPTRAQALLDAVLSPLVFEFLAGCAAAYTCTSGMPRLWTAVAGIASFGILIPGLIWSETLFAMPWLRVTVFGIGTALLLIGCFGEDAVISRLLPGFVIRIGDASYSLYLSHLFTISLVGRMIQQLASSIGPFTGPTGHVLALTITIAMALLVAEASYRWVETPLLRVTQRWVTQNSKSRVVSAT